MTSKLRFLIAAGSVALALGASAIPAQAQTSLLPVSVPSAIQVPEGNSAFLKVHAIGTQNYTCVPSGTGYIWKGAPQATLFVGLKWLGSEILQQVGNHYLSPNPTEGGIPRPTWQSSLDTSTVWGNPIANSSDPAFVTPGAIPWLLVQVVGAQRGPSGGSTLMTTSYIQRVNTSAGIAPTDACSATENLGVTKFMPYTADYIFYKESAKR